MNGLKTGLTERGAGMLAAEFHTRGANAQARAQGRATHWGRRMVREVQRRASGRPGPNIITGGYVRAITYELVSIGKNTGFVVGVNSPEDERAMRLELGFVGEDSLGRHYNQPPFPHFRPAADTLEPQIEASYGRLADFDSPMSAL